MKARKRSLDVLRFMAVLLVLWAHMDYCQDKRFLALISARLYQGSGGIAVILFFVLSGFLISGLLFKEQQRTGTISFRRFFIRRGFKIYPAFWAFTFLALIFNVSETPFTPKKLMADIFFVQNYFQGHWDHTWTLGVEEQFYIFLPLLLILMIKKCGRDPFRAIPKISLAIFVVSFFCRLSYRLADPYGPHKMTHTLFFMDALFFGVLISYFFHCRPKVFASLKSRLSGFYWLGWLFLLPGFFVDSWWWMIQEFTLGNFIISTAGYSLFWLGCGILLISVIDREELFEGRFWGLAAFVGANSYSIYLWHPLVIKYCRPILDEHGWYAYWAFCIVASLTFGVAMAKLVEAPTLKLRETLLPEKA